MSWTFFTTPCFPERLQSLQLVHSFLYRLKKMFTKALVIVASISAAFAVPFITQPVASTTFHGGQNATVSWQDNGSNPTLAQYGPCKISIYVGNAQQQTQLQSLNANVDVSKVNSITFTPDPTIGPNSNQYFIRMESLALKDTSQPQYPAMAFSSKFTLDGMTGTFSAAISSQISGQSTAPLASPTGTNSGTGASPTTTSGFTTSSKKPSSSSAPSPTASKSAADSIVFHGSWMGFLLSAFLGVTIL